MAIAFSCPCGCRLQVKEGLAGKLVKCPKCGKSVEAPNTKPAEVTAPIEKLLTPPVLQHLTEKQSVQPLDPLPEPIVFACSCGCRLRVRAELAGTSVKCPKCGKTVTAPSIKPAAQVTAPIEKIPAPVSSQPILVKPIEEPLRQLQAPLVGDDEKPGDWIWFLAVVGVVAVLSIIAVYSSFGVPRLFPNANRFDQIRHSLFGFVSRELFLATLEVTLMIVVLLKWRSAYWGKLVIAGLLLGAAGSLGNTIVFLQDDQGFFQGDLWDDSFARRIFPFFGFISYILVLLGLVSVPWLLGRRRSQPDLLRSEALPEQLCFKKRQPHIVVLLMIATFGLYVYWWLYCTVKELRSLDKRLIRFSPAAAIGFLLIPVFNLYWVFYAFIKVFLAVRDVKRRLPHDDTKSDYSVAAVVVLLVFHKILAAVAHFGFLPTFHSASAPNYHWYLFMASPLFTFNFAERFPLMTIFGALYPCALSLILLGYTQRHLNAVWSQVSELHQGETVSTAPTGCLVAFIVVTAVAALLMALMVAVLTFSG